MKLRTVLLFLFALTAFAAVTREASNEAADKFDRIARDQLESGETVVITEDEMNAYFLYDGATQIPEGIEDLEITLRDGGGAMEAVVDLDKAGSAAGDAPFFVRLLMSGERTVAAEVDYDAEDGHAEAKIVSVSIDGFKLTGAALEWFLSAFAPEEVQPFVSGEAVPLEGSLNSIHVKGDRVVMTAK